MDDVRGRSSESDPLHPGARVRREHKQTRRPLAEVRAHTARRPGRGPPDLSVQVGHVGAPLLHQRVDIALGVGMVFVPAPSAQVAGVAACLR